jgi:hypothetical protein
MFTVVGIAFAWGATNYSIGTGARMGPGYFPLILGVLMVLVGVAVSVKALVVNTPDGDKIGKWAWRPLVHILAANLSFGILLAGLPSINFPVFGLIIAIYALTLIASMAQPDWQLKTSLVLGTVLALGSYLVFVLALKLQFPVWPSFITG